MTIARMLGAVVLTATMATAAAAQGQGGAQGGAQGGHDQHQGHAAMHGNGPMPMPEGWSLRLDRANADRNAVRFGLMAGSYHVMTGPAAIFWNPANTASGAYSVEATFEQQKSPQHPEAYGLIWAGRNLDAANQDYLYVVIRKDGKYMIKHRAGAETHTIQDWTEHAAIVREDASGKQKNTLRVEVTATASRVLINGQLVRELPRQGMAANTDGIAGLRINHSLDVHIDGFAVRR